MTSLSQYLSHWLQTPVFWMLIALLFLGLELMNRRTVAVARRHRHAGVLLLDGHALTLAHPEVRKPSFWATFHGKKGWHLAETSVYRALVDRMLSLICS